MAPHQISSQRTLTPTQDLLAGAAAGTVSRLIVAPLDVLKIRFQVQHQTGLYRYKRMTHALHSIITKEGITALWKGNVSALMMVTPYASLQLAAFYQLRQASIITHEPYASLTIGAFSGAFATICTYPLDLLRTRFAAQPEPRLYQSIPHAIRVIYARDGVRGFYAGLGPTLVEIVPYIALHFAFYEGGKQVILQGQEPRIWESLTVGAASGTAAKLITLPLDNAKKLMQVERQFSGVGIYRGIAHVLGSVWRSHGLRGWFRGTAPSLVKAAPNSAITFAVYEKVKNMLATK